MALCGNDDDDKVDDDDEDDAADADDDGDDEGNDDGDGDGDDDATADNAVLTFILTEYKIIILFRGFNSCMRKGNFWHGPPKSSVYHPRQQLHAKR